MLSKKISGKKKVETMKFLGQKRKCLKIKKSLRIKKAKSIVPEKENKNKGENSFDKDYEPNEVKVNNTRIKDKNLKLGINNKERKVDSPNETKSNSIKNEQVSLIEAKEDDNKNVVAENGANILKRKELTSNINNSQNQDNKKKTKKDYKNAKITNKNNLKKRTEESEDSSSSYNDIESLGQIQNKENHTIANRIIIKKDGSDDIISVDKIKSLFCKEDYKTLQKYNFEYMTQSYFNNYIYKIDLKHFRKLLFICPRCTKTFRHYSMSYHIFQYHFEDIYQFLTDREIAKCCAKIMEKEKEKFEYSLKLYSLFATLFSHCQFRGASLWRETARDSILDLKRLNIEKKYFIYSEEEATSIMNKILPLNKNKNNERKHKKFEI